MVRGHHISEQTCPSTASTFARRLKSAGFTEAQAEALADANREMVVHDLASRDDLTGVKADLKADIAALEQRLMAVIENQTLRLTVRMGIMLAAALSLSTALTGALIKFH
jgi:hypothetical protein